jgi:putative tryptophan/tyrosine transport system substrate-binding protein
MNKSIIVPLLAIVILVSVHLAEAQQTKKVPKIGLLVSGSPSSTREVGEVEAFRQGLRELGYVEGQNIVIEYRHAQGKFDRLPELAADLVRLPVDVIVVAGGAFPIRAAKNATKTIPIVMMGQGSDPVRAGHVESLARPGGNVTGITNLSTELGGKRLELLKEAVPKLSRVAVLYDPANPPSLQQGERASPSRRASAGIDYSALGGTTCGRFREGIRCAKQAAPGWTLRGRGRANG